MNRGETVGIPFGRTPHAAILTDELEISGAGSVVQPGGGVFSMPFNHIRTSSTLRASSTFWTREREASLIFDRVSVTFRLFALSFDFF